MNCTQARQLFDAYLDGELSPSLTTELSVHRLHCPDCRRALALMEVSGRVLRDAREPVELGEDFTERLLACVDEPRRLGFPRLPRWVLVAGPLAAAAVLLFAMSGLFGGGKTMVAGVKVEPVTPPPPVAISDEVVIPHAPSNPNESAELALRDWIDKMQKKIEEKRQSGKTLQTTLDLTILQLLDILEDAKNASPSNRQDSGIDDDANQDRPANVDEEDVEDL